MLVYLSVFHLELGNIVPCLVFVCLQVELDDRTVSDWQGLSLFHLLKASFWFWLALRSEWLLSLALWPFWPFCEDVSSSEIQRPFLIVILFIADFNTSKHFREGSKQLFLEAIIELRPRLGKSIEERIKNRLSQCIKVLLKEHIILLLIRNRQKQPDVTLGNPLLQFRL